MKEEINMKIIDKILKPILKNIFKENSNKSSSILKVNKIHSYFNKNDLSFNKMKNNERR